VHAPKPFDTTEVLSRRLGGRSGAQDWSDTTVGVPHFGVGEACANAGGGEGAAMLHRAHCGYFEHGDKSASLTRTMKVCSPNREDLEAWAREHVGGRLKRCRSCM
jgi:hypothetical protein